MLFNKRNSFLLTCFILVLNLLSINANARKFYFSTSGNDSYTTAQAQNPNTPWKTLLKLETFGNSGLALAGDTFAFKRGDIFINGRNDFGSIKWWASNGYTCPSGTAQNPIVFTNYGTGALPNFLFPSPSTKIGSSRIVFAFNGVKYIVIDGLQFNDYRFPVNDKVSTAFTGMGILLGEEGVSSSVNNSVIKNCEFNNIGYGISTCGSYNKIINNKFTDFKNVGDTSGINDVGAVPLILQSGKFNLIQNNYIKGGWAFSGATASGSGLNGVGIEIINNFDSSKIIYNTIIDCAGAIEIGNITENPTIGCDNDTFAYNKIINTSVICFLSSNGVFTSNSSNLKFWNNVFIENGNSRFSGPKFGLDVYNDGQSFSNFTNWPSYPRNPSIYNYGGMRILQYSSEINLTKDTVYDSRNNIFWMTNRNQAVYDTSRRKYFRSNNIYHLVGTSVMGGNLNTGNKLEILTNQKIFSDTINLNPELWNFNLTNGSPAINFGRNIGLNNDFDGLPIVGNPDAGIMESSSSLINVLNVNINSTPILCFGGTSNVTIDASGGTPPYSGTGTFNVSAGTYNYTINDAVGNSKLVTITIPQPTALSLNTTSGRIIEFGGSTNISCSASGGKGTYTYKLDAGAYQTSSLFTSVLAGTHIVSVKDSNNCVTSKSITLTQPSAPLTITATPTIISCNGDSSFVTVTASGGTAPYTGIGRFSRLAGTHTFTISDSNGVTRSSTKTITQPTANNATVTSGSIGVYGAKTSITLSGVSGGTSPYSYSLSGGVYQTSNVFSNISAGNYIVNIKDAIGCVIQKPITITQPASTLNASATYSTISCFGSASNVTVSATGGTPPYLGTGTINSLGGIQTFTVTDAVGASKSVVLNIVQPPAIIPVITIGRIIEFGGTGSINVVASGGTGNLRYRITNRTYQSTGNFTSVIPGTYLISVKDGNSCVVTQSVTLTQPLAPLTITATPTVIACNGDSSFVTVTASGGTAPYTGIGRFSRVAGTYTFAISDSNGVTRSSTKTITQPTANIATVTSGSIGVYGAKTSITLSGVSGGTSPYSYSLNGGVYQTSNVFSNISAGNYIVNIKDAIGCVIQKAITITQPASTLNASATYTPISCFGSASNVTVSATGGTPPYLGTGTINSLGGIQTFTVTDAVGVSKSVVLNIVQPRAIIPVITIGRIIEFGGTGSINVVATGGTGTLRYSITNRSYQSTGNFTSLIQGTYLVSVIDENSCVVTQSVTLTQPLAPLTITATPTVIACNGDSSFVTVTASGGTAPYTGIGRFSRVAGTYTFAISDSNGVTRSSTITISQPTSIFATVSSGFISVAGGTTIITVSGVSGGVAPYTYSLNGGLFQNLTVFSNIPAGTHSVVIMDAKGCKITKTIVIVPPVQITYTFTNGCNNIWNGTITVGASFGTPPYNYQINNFGYNSRNVFINLGPATYRIYARDANGVVSSTTVSIVVRSTACVKSANQTVQDSTIIKTESSSLQLFSIYPNPAHDEFNIKISGLFNPSNYTLYNSKGQSVLSESITNKKQFSFGQFLAPGIYYIRFTEGNKVLSQKIIKIK